MAAPPIVTQLPPFANRARTMQGLFSIGGHIDAPANQDYVINIYVPCILAVMFGTFKLSSGTLTAAAKMGPDVGTLTAITGLSAIAVTSTIQSVDCSTLTDGTNIAAIGGVIVLTVSAGSSPLNFDFALTVQRR